MINQDWIVGTLPTGRELRLQHTVWKLKSRSGDKLGRSVRKSTTRRDTFSVSENKMEVFEEANGSDSVLDLSRLGLNDLSFDTVSDKRRKYTKQLYLCYNRITVLQDSICSFFNLEFLDISNNALTVVCEDITRLTKLKTLIAKNNRLNEFSLPKHFGSLQLEVLNFSGNRFEEMPSQCLQLLRLQSLSLGGNRLKSIPSEIDNLTR